VIQAAARVRRQGGADAGEDEQGALGAGRDGQAVGSQEGEHQPGGLHEDGGESDGEAGAAGGHCGLHAARVGPDEGVVGARWRTRERAKRQGGA
jgi:hypothetical protein